MTPIARINWVEGKRPSDATLRRWREMERLLGGLGKVMKGDGIDRWLRRPNRAFEGSTPLQVIERGESDRIWRMIYEAASGKPR